MTIERRGTPDTNAIAPAKVQHERPHGIVDMRPKDRPYFSANMAGDLLLSESDKLPTMPKSGKGPDGESIRGVRATLPNGQTVYLDPRFT